MAAQLTLIVGKTRQQHVEEISRAYQGAVDSVIATGRLILEAKEGPQKLPHGEFTAMIEAELPFVPRVAQRLMAIAKHPVLSNATNSSLLPRSEDALYELSRLPAEALQSKLADGSVNPSMRIRDARALKQEILPPPKPRSPQPPKTTDINDERKRFFGVQDACALEVQRAVFEALHEIPAPERGRLFLVLRKVLDELEQQFAEREQ